MNKITTRTRSNGYRSALPMVTSGVATAFLFLFAIAVVGFDAATNGQTVSPQDGTTMQTIGNGISLTSRG